MEITPMAPLHCAVAAGDVSTVRALIQGGHDMNAKDAAGLAPLFLAVRCEQSAVVRYLCESYADANQKSETGHARKKRS